MSGQFLISTGANDGVYCDYLRPVVVRLISAGQKFKTKEGFLRDTREHDSDKSGVEFEVELVDIDNEVARLWTCQAGLLKDLQQSAQGSVFAIGWKRVGPQNPDSKLTPFVNVAWEVDR
jgi:hypothetical protein